MTGKKATQASAAKTKKRSIRKKVARTGTRKTQSSTTGANKKTVTKKAVKRKAAVKKPVKRAPSKKVAPKRKTTPARQQKPHAPEPSDAAPTRSTPEDTRSLSWMSDQAVSALKAVKISQAEKGQPILARTRKQAAEKHINDDRLIEIAAEMPVENEALIEFLTEEPFQEHPPEAALSAAETVKDQDDRIPDLSVDTQVAPEATADPAGEAGAVPLSSAGQPDATLPPPRQPARQAARFRPALAASVIFAALLLGYYFWPGANDVNVNDSAVINKSAVVATEESAIIEVPVAEAEPTPAEPRGTATEDTASAPVAEPAQEVAENNHDAPPTDITRTPVPSSYPQTAAVPAVESAPEPEPAPAPKPVNTTPPVTPRAQPAVPAQRNYRAPVYSAYPQQRQPAYPQYYYR